MKTGAGGEGRRAVEKVMLHRLIDHGHGMDC